MSNIIIKPSKLSLELQLAISLYRDREFSYLGLPDKQLKAITAMNNGYTKTLFYGGAAGGGKTWIKCTDQVFKCLAYPGIKCFIGRDELKKIVQSTYITLLKVLTAYDIPKELFKVNWKYNYIECYNGSRIDLLDMKRLPRDPMFERFGSTEYTEGFIEEGGEIDHEAYKVLKTRVGRHMNKEYDLLDHITVTLNPKKNWIHKIGYKPFMSGELPADTMFIKALPTDNPYLTQSYLDNLNNLTGIQRERLLLGNFDYDDSSDRLIDDLAINKITDNTDIQHGDLYITCDVARKGKDKSVIMFWSGWRLEKVKTFDKNTTTELAGYILNECRRYNIPLNNVICDEDGVGGGVVDVLGSKGFVNNGRAFRDSENPENYGNLKDQCGYHIARLINSRQIYVNEFDKFDQLKEELEQVRIKNIDEPVNRLVPKDDIKAALGRSPDYWDALLMRMYFDLEKKFGKKTVKYTVDD